MTFEKPHQLFDLQFEAKDISRTVSVAKFTKQSAEILCVGLNRLDQEWVFRPFEAYTCNWEVQVFCIDSDDFLGNLI